MKRKLKLEEKPSNLQNVNEASNLKALVLKLEKEKNISVGHLRNLDWRLDQESKALHRAMDRRKRMQTEIEEAQYNLSSYQRLRRSSEVKKFLLNSVNKRR